MRLSVEREMDLAKWSTDGVLKALMVSSYGVKHWLGTARRWSLQLSPTEQIHSLEIAKKKKT